MSKGAELHEAVQELHLYLSDRIAPLMFAYSMDLLLEQPAALLAAEIRTWAGQQAAAMPGVSLADLLFHAVRKVSGIGEFDLVSGERLRAHVKELGEAVLAFCPAEDREILRQNLENLALAPPSATTGPVEILHRPPSPDQATGGAPVPRDSRTRSRPACAGWASSWTASSRRAWPGRPPSSGPRWPPSS